MGHLLGIDHILGQKLSINRFLKTSTKQSIFFDHNRMKLEINNRSKTRKSINIWKLNSTVLNNQLIKEENHKELRKSQQSMKIKIQHTKIYVTQQKQY